MEVALTVGTTVLSQEAKKEVINYLLQQAAKLTAQQSLKFAATSTISWVPIIGAVVTAITVVTVVHTTVTVIHLIYRVVELLIQGNVNGMSEEESKILSKAISETRVETQTKEKKDKDDDEGERKELHKPWKSLEGFRGKTKRDNSFYFYPKTGRKRDSGKTYYYELDRERVHNHGPDAAEVEVYVKRGSRGVHVGVLPLTGGELNTYRAVPGRTIEL